MYESNIYDCDVPSALVLFHPRLAILEYLPSPVAVPANTIDEKYLLHPAQCTVYTRPLLPDTVRGPCFPPSARQWLSFQEPGISLFILSSILFIVLIPSQTGLHYMQAFLMTSIQLLRYLDFLN